MKILEKFGDVLDTLGKMLEREFLKGSRSFFWLMFKRWKFSLLNILNGWNMEHRITLPSRNIVRTQVVLSCQLWLARNVEKKEKDNIEEKKWTTRKLSIIFSSTTPSKLVSTSEIAHGTRGLWLTITWPNYKPFTYRTLNLFFLALIYVRWPWTSRALTLSCITSLLT